MTTRHVVFNETVPFIDIGRLSPDSYLKHLADTNRGSHNIRNVQVTISVQHELGPLALLEELLLQTFQEGSRCSYSTRELERARRFIDAQRERLERQYGGTPLF